MATSSRAAVLDGVSILENLRLATLSAELKAFDAGHVIVKGRLELCAISRRRLSRKQHVDLHRRSPESYTDSPLGPMESASADNLFVNLLALVNLLYQDYDCSRLTPQDFRRCTDMHAVVAAVNRHLASVVERTRPGFLHELWQAAQEAIDLERFVQGDSEVYALEPRAGTFAPTDNSLMSFQFFFVDLFRGRILFMGGETRAKGAGAESDMSISEDGMSMGSASLSNRASSPHSELREDEIIYDDDSGNEDL